MKNFIFIISLFLIPQLRADISRNLDRTLKFSQWTIQPKSSLVWLGDSIYPFKIWASIINGIPFDSLFSGGNVDSITRVKYTGLDSFFLWQEGVIRAQFEVDYPDSVLWSAKSDTAKFSWIAFNADSLNHQAGAYYLDNTKDTIQTIVESNDTLIFTESGAGVVKKVKVKSADSSRVSSICTDKDTLTTGTYTSSTASLSLSERNRVGALAITVRPDSVAKAGWAGSLQGKDTTWIKGLGIDTTANYHWTGTHRFDNKVSFQDTIKYFFSATNDSEFIYKAKSSKKIISGIKDVRL